MTPSIDPAARTSMTAEERLAAKIDARLAERLPKLVGYATPERARYCPSSLRQPYGSGAWMPISEAERAKVIEANLRAQILAELRPQLVQVEAPTAPVEDTPSPSPATPSRYVVACVAGCGSYHPATSGRPVLVSCGDERGLAVVRRKRDIFDGYEGADGTARLIARLRDEAIAARRAELAASTTPRRKKPGKPRKRRRRAVCAKTKEQRVND